MRCLACALVAVLAPSAPSLADGNGPPVAPIPQPADGNPTYHPIYASPSAPIVITEPGERGARDLAACGGIAGAGIVLAAVGVYFNLDARSAANSVSAGAPTGRSWTAAEQATYDRAHDSGVKAAVFYGVGGAALVGALVAWIATAPAEQRVVIHPHVTPVVAPTPGGALLGGMWSF